MANKITTLFDLNQNQVKATDNVLLKIREWSSQINDWPYEKMQIRIKEMKAELKILVDKIPQETKFSLRKVDRVKGLTKEEKDIQTKLMEFLPEVYAFMDEIYFRKMKSRYHEVQLRAATVLAQGQRLVELYTGEGKTRTFQLPLMLYSLVGRGTHLITVNDYLSRRDGEYAGHIAGALGLTTGIITSNAAYKFINDDEIKTYKGEEGVKSRGAMKNIDISSMEAINLIECNKRDAYNCDITYGTNNEFGFDYLRDNMAWDLNNISQRELYFCIIDEADSILIDEARTPLIISGVPTEANVERYINFAQGVKDLVEGKDYVIDHKTRSVTLTEEGIVNVENKLEINNLWEDYSMAYHIENALKAQTLFSKDEHYLVKAGEVLIVDEFTGRTLKGRRYSEGLHQAIEAKEGVQVQQESKTFATITFQNFFRLYKILCGGSGTIMTEAEEFYKIYGLESVVIPTNRQVIRDDFGDKIYKTQEAKFKAVIEEIKEMHDRGQPVLVGTTSVDKSEIISSLLDAIKIPHEVLNAKYHEQEAKIIERAGRRSAVTVATNMAGRGADIIIGGGSRGDEAYEEIKSIGGLHVIGTERHEARRIDNQLRGRTGRQGEPGSSRFYVALNDQLMKVLGGEIMGTLMNRVGLQDDMPIELKLISRQIESAQKRIEGLNFDSRKRIVEYDDVMNQHREIFYTRRRNILQASEEASGKFIEKGMLVDINLNEFKNQKEKYDEKIEAAKIKLEKNISKLIIESVKELINKQFQQYRRLNKSNVEKIYKEYTNLVPEYLIAKALNVQINKITDIVTNEIADKRQDKIIQFFIDLTTKVIKIKIEEFGNSFFYLAKALTLQTMDNVWVDHLELMKDIKEGIGLQAYAQKDPLVEYKNEAFIIFESFIQTIDKEVVKQLLGVQKIKQTAIDKDGNSLVISDPTQQTNLITNQSQIEDILTEDREFIDVESIQQSKLDTQVQSSNSLLKRIDKERAMQEASSTGDRDVEGKRFGTTAFKNFNRNDKVTVKYEDGSILKDVKFKKVEKDLLDGKAKIVQ